MENKNNNGGSIVGIILIVLFVVFSFISCGDTSSGSKRKWSDLSETEKNNARWAYEAKQYIDSQK